jgi:hypothetical protein
MSGRMYAMIPGSDNDDRSLEHVFAQWTEKVINIENIINIDVTYEEYRNLVVIIQEARQHGLKSEQIESKVRETPFANLAGLLPRDRAELYAFLALLLAVIQLVVNLRTSNAPTITPEQVREIIQQVEQDSRPQTPTVTPSVPSVTPPAHGRK